MSDAADILGEHARRRARLAELGVDEEDLTGAVLRGTAEAARWTPNHPKTARGLMRWIGEVAEARERLTKKGWKSNDEDNYPRVLNSTGTMAIAFSTGDVHTGLRGQAPRTPPRGKATKAVIDVNQSLLADFFRLARGDPSYPRDARYSQPQTWVLLHYEDEEASEVRQELSLPAGQAVDGSINSWTERIIFPPISIGPAPVTRADEQGEPIDIPVHRAN